MVVVSCFCVWILFFNRTVEKTFLLLEKMVKRIDWGGRDLFFSLHRFSPIATNKYYSRRKNAHFCCANKTYKIFHISRSSKEPIKKGKKELVRFSVIIKYTQNVITTLNLFTTCSIARWTTTWNCYCFLLLFLFYFILSLLRHIISINCTILALCYRIYIRYLKISTFVRYYQSYQSTANDIIQMGTRIHAHNFERFKQSQQFWSDQ